MNTEKTITAAPVRTDVNPACSECVRLGTRCESCRKWDAVMERYRPRWERQNRAKKAAAERRERELEQSFASWDRPAKSPVASEPKKNYLAGQDAALPPSDRD